MCNCSFASYPLNVIPWVQERHLKSKHKTKKKKRYAKSDRREVERHSGSPVVGQTSSSPAVDADTAEGLHVQKPQSPAAAADLEQTDRMDNFLLEISAATPANVPGTSSQQQETLKAIAPRLQEVSGKTSGLVGDGGSNWRRRMQRRAADRAAERGILPGLSTLKHATSAYDQCRILKSIRNAHNLNGRV